MASAKDSAPPLQNRTSSLECLYIVPSFTVVWGLHLFPLSVLVLHCVFQRWRQNQRATLSHTDFFTFLMLVLEVLLFCGYAVTSYAILRFDDSLKESGVYLLYFASPGVLSLHALTCVERYLAVVHPVVYLSLKKRRWIRARNCIVFVILSIGALWLCVVHELEERNVAILCLLGSVTGIILFCNVQVLRALRTPSPGDGRGVGRSKRKAFYTTLAILSTLLLWFIWEIIICGSKKASLFEPHVMCTLELSGCWFELPSSLVLPLLFLHRAGKLPKCQSKEMKKPGLELR